MLHSLIRFHSRVRPPPLSLSAADSAWISPLDFACFHRSATLQRDPDSFSEPCSTQFSASPTLSKCLTRRCTRAQLGPQRRLNLCLLQPLPPVQQLRLPPQLPLLRLQMQLRLRLLLHLAPLQPRVLTLLRRASSSTRRVASVALSCGTKRIWTATRLSASNEDLE